MRPASPRMHTSAKISAKKAEAVISMVKAKRGTLTTSTCSRPNSMASRISVCSSSTSPGTSSLPSTTASGGWPASGRGSQR